MARITQEQRNRYFDKVKEYKVFIDGIIAHEKTIASLLSQDEAGAAFKRLHLAEEMLDLASWHLLINSVSVAFLGMKNDDILIDGRKIIMRALKYLEDVVTNRLDVPFSEYEKNLDEIREVDVISRYRLLRKFCFAIECFEAAFGENSKYNKGFNEIWGKLSALGKNMIDLRTVMTELDFNSSNRDSMKAHLAIVKDLFKRSADRYREEYELYSHKLSDFRIGIQYLSALRRIHASINERDEAEKMKRNIEVWNTKYETDSRKKAAQA
jgi:hypothetical protein